jgi:GNAT superfamily N-acetyltransferase
LIDWAKTERAGANQSAGADMIVHDGAKVGQRGGRFRPDPSGVRRTVLEERPMASAVGADVALETNPKPEEIGVLEERLYEFNVCATGTRDARLFAWFLRDENHTAIGGLYGWTWGAACYVRYLFVPEPLRNQGYGSALMLALEAEAKARGCLQIILETHDFQAPGFYRRLGFEVTGRVDDYPRGHQYLTMVKRLEP